jgi:hypothetical protein
MSRSEPDATRIVRLWLEEGVTALPDHVLDTVLDKLPATSQRRSSWLARRPPTMNKIVTIGLAAAAVVVVAFLGYQAFLAPNVGAPGPSPSPAAEPVNFTELVSGGTELFPGEYLIDHAAPAALVTFTVPDEPYGEWSSPWQKALFDSGPHHQSNAGVLGVAQVDNIYVDPCDPALGPRDPAVGPSVDDFVTALGDVPGVVASEPEDAELSGYTASYVELTGERPADCHDDHWMFDTTRGDPGPLTPDTGDLVQVWVFDLEGQRLVIWAESHAEFAQADHLEALVDSLVIEIP